MMWLVPAGFASAAGDRHQVPDLRRGNNRAERIQKKMIEVRVTIHVAADIRGRRVVRWIERANRALRPYGMRVSIADVQAMPTGYSRIERRRDRRNLARFAPTDGTIHVFIVDDVTLGRRRALRRGKVVRGMHWRYRGLRRGLRGREYVVVATHAPNTTLAHEIGHLFGLRHRAGDSNLMCSCREGPGQGFTTSQGVIMRAGAARFMSRQRRR